MYSLFFSECNCGIGSSNQSCLDDGICYCLPGTMGTKCEECLPFYSTLSSNGCQPCDGCESMLAFQLFTTEDSIMAIRFNFSSFLSLLNHDLAFNSLINSTVYSLLIRRSSLEIFDVIETNLTALNETTLQLLLMNSLTTKQRVSMISPFL